MRQKAWVRRPPRPEHGQILGFQMRWAYKLFEGASQITVGYDVIGVDLFHTSLTPLADLYLCEQLLQDG